MVDFPTWPCDCNSQVSVVDQILDEIEIFEEEQLTNIIPTTLLRSGSVPEQGNFDAKWLADDRELPIPTGANISWYNTDQDTFGGQYVAIDGDVHRAEHWRVKGTYDTIYVVPDEGVPATFAMNSSYDFTSPAARISMSFEIDHPCYLYFNIQMSHLNAVTDAGINYAVNGVNEENVLFGGASTTNSLMRGYRPATTSLRWYWRFNWLHHEVLQPGSYVVQVQTIGTGAVEYVAPALGLPYLLNLGHQFFVELIAQ